MTKVELRTLSRQSQPTQCRPQPMLCRLPLAKKRALDDHSGQEEDTPPVELSPGRESPSLSTTVGQSSPPVTPFPYPTVDDLKSSFIPYRLPPTQTTHPLPLWRQPSLSLSHVMSTEPSKDNNPKLHQPIDGHPFVCLSQDHSWPKADLSQPNIVQTQHQQHRKRLLL